ncbi:unnamed protein product [Absidia cylindrospora]
MASKDVEGSLNITTRSQAVDRKRSRSPDANTSSTKKRSASETNIVMDETAISNSKTNTTLPEASNTNNDIPMDVTEIFEEVDGTSVTQGIADSWLEIDIESLDAPTEPTKTVTATTTTTTTTVLEPMIPNPAIDETNGLTETSAPKTTEPAETLVPEPAESTDTTASAETKEHTESQSSGKENRPSDSLIERDTAATSISADAVSAVPTALDTTPTKTQTSKKHHPGLTPPDKSSAVRQPFSDKFFITDEAYDAYSHDNFMATIDSITKKNKPGLALSLEPPTSSSSISRPPNMQPTHPHPHPQQHQRPSHLHGTASTTTPKSSSITPDNSKSSNPSSTPTTTNTSSNILDSLLDSISKNDRPVMKPAHVPSDIEIAMQAADSAQTHPQE